MKALVVYASRLGSTKVIAERINARLRGHGIDTTITSVDTSPDVTGFDAVVLGSAVYAGRWLAAARDFVRSNQQHLAGRRVWLFSSGPIGRASAAAEIASAEVRSAMAAIGAIEHRVFAGSFDRSAIDGAGFPLIVRVIAKRCVPQGDFREWAAIDAWADEVATDLTGTRPPEAGRAFTTAAR